MRRVHFLVSVSGRTVTKNFLPILLSVSMTKGTEQTADTVRFDLDDRGGHIRFPNEGEPVHVELGWEGGAIRTFDGEVDTPSWSISRSTGSVLSVTARSASLKGKERQPREAYWDNKDIATIIKDAGKEAGIDMSVHPSFSSMVRGYEAQDNESFMAFGERLAREYGAIFRIDGKRGVMVPYHSAASGAALSEIVIQRRDLIAASGFAPVVNRPRVASKTVSFYDLDEARRLAARYMSGDTVEVDDKDIVWAADEEVAGTRAKSGSTKANREKARGNVTINGTPEAQPGGKVTMREVRAGVDGAYSISGLTDQLTRAAGYTTSLTLGEPQGEAGVDAR